MDPNLIEIRERLARIETTQGHTNTVLERIEGKFDDMDNRVRTVEMKAAGYGTIAGGVVSVAVALISAKLSGKA